MVGNVRGESVLAGGFPGEDARGQFQPGGFVQGARGDAQIVAVIPIPAKAAAALPAKSPKLCAASNT